jgi:hypothetical protein
MNQSLLPRLLLAFFIVITGLILSTIKIDYSVKGVRILPLPARCELWILDKPNQPEQTFALACPSVELIRLWPLPAVQPWDAGGSGNISKLLH